MFTILAPVLAQLVTVAVSDRTEGRVVVADDTHYEASTSPSIGLGFTEKRFHLQLAYSPSFTVTPLESKPRQLLVFHNVSMGASYGWRRTTLSVGQSLSFGEQNFRVAATSGSAARAGNGSQGGVPPGSATPPPSSGGVVTPGTIVSTPAPNSSANPTLNLDRTVTILNYSASAGVSHTLSPALSVSATAGYGLVTSASSSPDAYLPKVQGPSASASVSDRLSMADMVSSTLSLQYSFSSDGNHTLLSTLGTGWGHAFNVMTSSQLNVGLSGARASRRDGYVAYSIYPTFGAGLSHVRPLHPGTLSLSLNASAAPALDFETLIVDPRVGFGGSAGYSRDSFFAGVSLGSSYSISAERAGAFSGVSGSAGVGYRISGAVSVDSGVRVAWQAYEGRTALPWTYAAYLGLSVAFGGRL